MGHDNFNEMRKAMVVSQLRTTEVSDPRVIEAMSHVPRENFVPAASRNVAYSDRGVQVGQNRALNSPLATGRLLTAAQITAEDNVLLVGAATGYTAAVLAQVAHSVVAIEQSTKLASRAKENLSDVDNITVEKTDHANGFATDAPYSVIIIDGVIEEVSDALVDQLDTQGRLVGAILDGGVARLAIGHKAGNSIGYQYFADCGGVALPGFEKTESFSF